MRLFQSMKRQSLTSSSTSSSQSRQLLSTAPSTTTPPLRHRRNKNKKYEFDTPLTRSNTIRREKKNDNHQNVNVEDDDRCIHDNTKRNRKRQQRNLRRSLVTQKNFSRLLVMFVIILVLLLGMSWRKEQQRRPANMGSSNEDGGLRITRTTKTILMIRVTERTKRKQVYTTNPFLQYMLSHHPHPQQLQKTNIFNNDTTTNDDNTQISKSVIMKKNDDASIVLENWNRQEQENQREWKQNTNENEQQRRRRRQRCTTMNHGEKNHRHHMREGIEELWKMIDNLKSTDSDIVETTTNWYCPMNRTNSPFVVDDDDCSPSFDIYRRSPHHRIPKIIHQLGAIVSPDTTTTAAITRNAMRQPPPNHNLPMSTYDHPKLTRFQNSWRSQQQIQNWNYRTYTISSAQKYVRRHFFSKKKVIENNNNNSSVSSTATSATFGTKLQSIFDAFPISVQMEFFRWFVLYHVGGVYANVNVLLETNLDALIPSHVGFVAAREDVSVTHTCRSKVSKLTNDDSSDNDNDCTQNHQHHCLWTGIIASEPHHPFIGRVLRQFFQQLFVDTMVTEPESAKQQEYDSRRHLRAYIEKRVRRCRGSKYLPGELEAKINSVQPMDLLWGSCMLGRAVNAMLGRDVLTDFEPGVIEGLGERRRYLSRLSKEAKPITVSTLILMMSQNDTGSYRCSDVDRNILVASTDHDVLSEIPWWWSSCSKSNLRCGRQSPQDM